MAMVSAFVKSGQSSLSDWFLYALELCYYSIVIVKMQTKSYSAKINAEKAMPKSCIPCITIKEMSVQLFIFSRNTQ